MDSIITYKKVIFISLLYTLFISMPTYSVGYRVSDIEYRMKISEEDPNKTTSVVFAEEDILKPLTAEVKNYRTALRALESDITATVSAEIKQEVTSNGASLKSHYFRFNDRLENSTIELSTIGGGGIEARVGPLSIETYTKASKYGLSGKVYAVTTQFYITAQYSLLTGLFNNVEFENFDMDLDVDVDGLLILGPIIDFFYSDSLAYSFETELENELDSALDDINITGFSLNIAFDEILSEFSSMAPLPSELAQYQYLADINDFTDLTEAAAKLFMGIESEIASIEANQKLLALSTSEFRTNYGFTCGGYNYSFYFDKLALTLQISDDVFIELQNFPQFGPNPGTTCPIPGDQMHDQPGTNDGLCEIGFTDTTTEPPGVTTHQCLSYAENLVDTLIEDIFEDLLGVPEEPTEPPEPSDEIACSWTKLYVIPQPAGYAESQGCYDASTLAATRTVGGGPSGNFCYSLVAKAGYSVSGSCWSPTVTRL